MKFKHPNQRKIFDLVYEYLDELFEDPYHDEETGHTYVQYGSTVLEISVEPYGPEDAVVTIMSYCVQDVEIDDDLLLGLLELNHNLPFGSFSVVGNDIFMSHTLLGRTLERRNLLSAISAVATISDDYDDLIVKKYGGQRALDRIRDTGGREQRKAATSVGSETPAAV